VAGRRARFRLWRRWLDAIETEIFEIAHRRRLYRETREMVEKNPKANVPSAWFTWFQRMYVNDQVTAVRRQVDWDRRSISLVQLIQDIAANPDVITRRRFIRPYDTAMKNHAHRDFEKFAKPGAKHIDARLIQADARALIDAHERLRRFVNTYVAHRNRYPMRRLPTFKELDDCIDLFGRLLQRYTLLLTQAGLIEVVPTLQEDWRAPFRVPWIRPEREK
jgi:hypothetical protein